MEEISLDAQLEAVLFWKGEPQSVKRLANILGKTEDEILVGLEVLKEKVKGRGVELLFLSASSENAKGDKEVMLGTAARFSPIIEKLTKEELIRDLGKAGLETISIIAYHGPISRAEIDYIRGVQSNFILRNLQIRGLVEKISNEKDHRSFLYRPTFELLSYLGVSKVEDLPEYEKVKMEFAQNVPVKSETTLTEDTFESEAGEASGEDLESAITSDTDNKNL